MSKESRGNVFNSAHTHTRVHTHTHTCTHSHTHSLTHTQSHTHSHTLAHTLSLTHSHTHTDSLTCARSHSLTHTLSLSPSLSLSLSLSLSHLIVCSCEICRPKFCSQWILTEMFKTEFDTYCLQHCSPADNKPLNHTLVMSHCYCSSELVVNLICVNKHSFE